MGMNELLAALTRDAEAEAEAVRRAADSEAAALLATASQQYAERFAAEVELARRAYQSEADAEVAAAALEARHARLSARAEMLERLRAAVHARLPALLQHAELVDHLVSTALVAAGDRAATVRCPPVIAERVRDHAGNVPVSSDPDCGSGVRVTLAGDRGEVDATLETFVDNSWPQLCVAALQHVEGRS